jgi:putative phosphoesterase
LKKIGLLSDTHGYLDEAILNHLSSVDEIWHAGDFGTIEASEKLSSLKKLRGVYGNIDGTELRIAHPLHNRFQCEKVDVWITHIGGYPGNYNHQVKNELFLNPPRLFICGHSHILKVVRDKQLNNMLHINPGAAGTHGFHKARTMMRFKIEAEKIFDLDVIELGLRGDLPK